MTDFYINRFDIRDTDNLKQSFDAVLEESPDTEEEWKDWLERRSALLDEIEEIITGHYIEFQCFSDDEDKKAQVEFDQQHIEPLRKAFQSKADKKFLQSPAAQNPSKELELLVKRLRNQDELYSEANTQLEIEEDALATRYFEITGSMNVEWEGETLSLSELSPKLESSSRAIREKAFRLVSGCFKEQEEELQSIMSSLIKLRQKKADNAGLSNYRDYMFRNYERFDYSPEDCKQLAESIKRHIVPLKDKYAHRHMEELQLFSYRPWDLRGTPAHLEQLKPFSNAAELTDKSKAVLNRVHPSYGSLLESMYRNNRLDLEARQGKAPGGFCCYLPVSRDSFIFMNAAEVHDDMITILHEMGHCLHNDRSSSFSVHEYRSAPMESAELASMSMELLTMNHWSEFYGEDKDMLRAKHDHFRDILNFLPVGSVVDQFQHWLYENPQHSEQERLHMFRRIQTAYDSSAADWSGLEHEQEISWMRILHIYEVPFYFIEYVIAQLGALQVYRNYQQDPGKTLEAFNEALKLGSSRSLPEVYEAAGIRFDFSDEMVKELADFIEQQLEE
ncbi:M3 family oligoendopeptidase [Alkalicoccus luteus]|uniref:M3 family oligoendopeptidase n=1 Tax=Alkalicoccus luteus TaxID=1237094 RepID=A0A969PLZ5_9BACI|nr:M3 family oligoendopeptidase [Alkalicoccus luteus]NJP36642.1 M3 family oligoendopeptidase [Alkalicoccus luteus]